MNAATRICAEQDCNQPPNRPNQPLCYDDYLKLRDGTISLCSDCQVTYKPVECPVCRNCYRRQRSSHESGRGWGTALQEPAVPQSLPTRNDVRAIKTVRKNMVRHWELCINREDNTIQYLVDPLLKGLGWDTSDPAQVVREYAPTGKKWHGNHNRVDVALFVDSEPIVFIEVKRLDREFRDEYMHQLNDYAFNMNSGFAVLTNGQYWLISYVTGGVPQPRGTLNIMDGSAKEAAGKLNEFIGKTAIVNARRLPPTSEQIMEALRNYRGREAQRRRRPAFTIFSDATIALIAEWKPANSSELQSIKGVGPTILRQHGEAILGMVAGRME